MAKTKISEFDVDPANNTDINSINIAEGCAPSGINNAIRQLMSDLKEFQTGAASDSFTVGGAFSANGGATLGDASGDALTINSSAVSIPNGLNFDSNTLVIDATNNRVGVGTASPSYKFDAIGSGDVARIDTSSSGGLILSRVNAVGNASSHFITSFKNSDSIVASIQTINRTGATTSTGTGYELRYTAEGTGYQTWYTNSTERMRLDSSGNLGLGVTPSAWVSTYKAFEMSYGALAGGTTSTALFGNSYWNGTNSIYKTTAAASQYAQAGGQHIWYTAPSGTAGNAITFTQAMTLDADGDLMLGRTSSSNYRAQITGSSDLVDIAGTSVSTQFHNKTADIFMIGVGSGDGIAFATNGNTTERARITSDGYLRMASGTGGIQFNGDTAAANALDDYEEGTFTPTITGNTTAGTGTYTTQIGSYTKIGNVVHVQITIVWTNHTGTGGIRISSLPFTSAASGTYSYGQLQGYISNVTLTANNYFQGLEVVAATTNALCYQGPVGGGTGAQISMDTAGQLEVSGCYFV
jgi:hypothetical protein